MNSISSISSRHIKSSGHIFIALVTSCRVAGATTCCISAQCLFILLSWWVFNTRINWRFKVLHNLSGIWLSILSMVMSIWPVRERGISERRIIHILLVRSVRILLLVPRMLPEAIRCDPRMAAFGWIGRHSSTLVKIVGAMLI